jgi:hypothetical protein
MKTADFASGIKGFRFLPGEPGYQYQTTQDFSLESAMKLLRGLPPNCQMSFFDPEEKKDEAWIFVRRVGGGFQVMRANRGFSKWKDEPLDRVLQLFMSSPLVKKPLEDFDSFRVDLIADQR